MSRELVARYFAMWNTHDTTIADEVLDPGWVDHSHPEVTTIDDVKRAVEGIPAGLRFRVDAILEDPEKGMAAVLQKGTQSTPLFAVIGGVGASNLIWLIRVRDGRMAEMWTYRTGS